MKKIVFLFIAVVLSWNGLAQNKLPKVAVAVRSDTVFTLLGNISLSTMPYNLHQNWSKYLNDITGDAFHFEMVDLPDYYQTEKRSHSTQLQKSDLAPFFKALKKKGYAYLVFVYRPELKLPLYNGLEGTSYGFAMSKNQVFSLNSADIYAINKKSLVANVGLRTPEDFILSVSRDAIPEMQLKQYNESHMKPAVEFIENLHQQFAGRIAHRFKLMLDEK